MRSVLSWQPGMRASAADSGCVCRCNNLSGAWLCIVALAEAGSVPKSSSPMQASAGLPCMVGALQARCHHTALHCTSRMGAVAHFCPCIPPSSRQLGSLEAAHSSQATFLRQWRLRLLIPATRPPCGRLHGLVSCTHCAGCSALDTACRYLSQPAVPEQHLPSAPVYAETFGQDEKYESIEG